MRFPPTFCLLLAAVALAGCTARTAPRVTMLGDGVLVSPTEQEAEAYCRNFGAPMRFLDEKPAGSGGPYRYRCD